MTQANNDSVSATNGTQVRRTDVVDFAKRLADIAPTDFTRDVLNGTSVVLADRDNPIRLNLFAVSIRILLDHLMDALAPRDQVEACRWFAYEEEQDKPTRRQRLAYALHGGFTSAEVKDLAQIDAEDLVDETTKAYRKLNKHVHGREETIVRNVDEQDVTIDLILGALADLLEAEQEYRREIVDGIADTLASEAVQQFLMETIEDLDIMATHHEIEWVGVDEQSVVGIDATHVEFQVEGSVGVTLLYGSSRDRRSGDGAEMSEEFPFEVRFKVGVDHPHDLSRAEITKNVDTAAWYGPDDLDDEETLVEV
jgi:hypothetical protein